MHREVQIKHDLMTRNCKYTLMAWDTKRAVCVRKQTVFILFLPLVITVMCKYSEGEGASVCAQKDTYILDALEVS